MGFFKQKIASLSLYKRLLVYLILGVLAVLCVLALTVKNYTGLTFFQRNFTYNNQTGDVAYFHGTRSDSLYTSLSNGLLITSDKSMTLRSVQGDTLLSEEVSVSYPALSTNGTTAVVYDAGGQNLYVVQGEKMVFSLSMSGQEYILSAYLNEKGWLAVTTKEDGYRGVVTVYDSSFSPVLAIKLSSTYITSAIVTPDCKGLYVVSPGQKNGNFDSTLLYYNLSDASEAASQISLGDTVVLSMESADNRVWVLTEDKLAILLSTGELSAKYDYDGMYLQRASLEGTGFATLFLSPSPSGNTGELVTINTQGEEVGSTALSDQVLAISANGSHVSALCASGLYTYSSDLRGTQHTDIPQAVQNIVQYPDGNVALITSELVRLYIP